MILTIRTDKPEAEVGLFEAGSKLAYIKWRAHRELSSTIHRQIEAGLKKVDGNWADITGIVVYKGPGSFTGLRIGLSLANALASTLSVPIVGTSGTDWAQKGLKFLQKGRSQKIILPNYGQLPKTTTPKK